MLPPLRLRRHPIQRALLLSIAFAGLSLAVGVIVFIHLFGRTL
jgi:hypothetical protein